ncbi:MAG: FG-GAP-like repeat-containing protein [Lentimicrobiaceae bacterium]|nr:FG-GAP-like repeat-containing protein [Lentimicrobiaceae bacterium]
MNKNYKKHCFLRSVIILFLHIIFTTGFMLQAQNTQFPVGAIPGAIDVSPMGAATYTIPIEVVPGTMGMQPNLSIVYNSFSGMGLLGMKWNLAGLSAITRCGQTPYYDNNITAIQFNCNDRFAIDGERLLRLNRGDYCAVDGEYATEMENFTRIVSYLGTHGNPGYFLAYTDNGTIIEYGNSSNSKQTMEANKTLSWYINKITDANGNYMTFNYSNSNNEISISEILYTFSSGFTFTQYAEVRFSYRGLPNTLGRNTYFVGGYGVPQSRLLTDITVNYKDTIARRYQFIYDFNDSREHTAHLKRVVLYGEDEAEQFNETTIEWGERNTDIQEKITGLPLALDKTKILTGDFNGDGYTDLLVYHKIVDSGDGERTHAIGWRLYLYDPLTGSFYEEQSAAETSLFHSKLYAQDVNGDGKDELIICTGVSGTEVKILSLPSKAQIGATLPCSSASNIYFGDFDGNGSIDFAYNQFNGPNQPITTRVKKVEGDTIVDMGTIESALLAVFDANGNGKKNIRAANNTIYEFNGTTFQSIGQGGLLSSATSFLGDFNGDGITDELEFCYGFGGTSTWKIHISKGDGSCEVQILDSELLDNTSISQKPMYSIIIADINGDGKDDIIQVMNSAPNPSTGYPPYRSSFNVLFSKGWVNGNYIYEKKEINVPSVNLPWDDVSVGDFNGDGKMDLIVSAYEYYYGQIGAIYYINENDYEFVKKITDGLAKEIQLNYKQKYFLAEVSHWNNAFSGSIRKCFLPVVDIISVSNGIGKGLNIWQYQYEFPVFSLPRKIFLGFKEFVCINQRENKKDAFLFAVDNSRHKKIPVSQKTYYNNVNWNEIIYNFSFMSLGSKRYMPYPNETTVKDTLYDIKTVTITTLNDDTGRLEKIETKTYEQCNACADSWIHLETSTYACSLITLDGCQKKTVPTKILTTQQFRDNGILSPITTDTLTYDYYLTGSNKGRLNWERQGNTDGSITISYGDYTNTGIYKEKTVSAAGCTARIKKYKYDDTERFIKQITNPLDHEINITYDPKTGNKLSESDPNGLTTTYSYDTFGNLTQINYPDGTQTDVSINWYQGRDLPNARYYTTTTSTGKPDLIVYYDILGREVCRLEDEYYMETYYNDKGQVEKTSYLFQDFRHSDRYKIWYQYAYDSFGRKGKEKAPYMNLLYTYNNRRVTITDRLRNNIFSYKDYDALGRIIKAEDEGGTIDYSYTVINENNEKRYLTTITTNEAISRIRSDLWGNRLSIKESNAGEIVSTYNGFNELKEQTDARGNKTFYEYDKLGRVTKKQLTGATPQTVNYYYDGANYGVGKLHKVSQGTQTQELFSYDALGRLAIHTKSIDRNAIQNKHSYTYNANGQLHTLTYPSGFGVTYSYTETGKLNEIRRSDNNDLIYRVSSRNKYQQPNCCYFGNDMGTDYTYNAHGLLTRINTGNMITIGTIDPGDTAIIGPGETDFSGGPIGIIGVDSAILNYRYAYDDKGLMISRSENIIDRLEKYEYDNLDRLTKITSGAIGQTGTPQTFSYHSNGNISNNSNVGYYSYMGKPHAVGRIEPVSPDAMSNNQCDVIYNSFNQPTKITEGNHWLDLSYDVNQQRQKTERYKNGYEEMTRYYINKGYEIDRYPSGYRKKHYHYIYGDNGVVALYIGNIIIEQDTTTGGGIILPKSISFTTDSMYYIHTDHLGSYCAITGANKGVVQRNYFDPWGNFRLIYRTRNGFSMEDAEMPNDSLEVGTIASMNFKLTDRGFTGHEHYPFFKIINMNGRLYDPVIGRFFSPDNYVQLPEFTQAYNRYSYALNNPLRYVDPTGQWYEDVDYNWEWNITTNTWTQTGPDGGPNYHYVDIVDDWGKKLGEHEFAGNSWESGVYIDDMGRAYVYIDSWESGFADGFSFGVGHYNNEFMTSPSPYGITLDVPLIERGDTYTVAPSFRPSPGTITYSPINVGDFVFAVKGLFTAAARILTNKAIDGAARGGMQYTKSNFQIGREMHNTYKVGLENKITTFKEFTKVPGIRPDFVDFSTKTIYELKPFNPRGIRQGWDQLYKYQSAFQQKYGGSWEIVLDLY